jgi:periplasmic protein TonB
MNIHKYLIPASIAATLHVALLWLAPDQPYSRIVEVPLGKASPPPPDPVVEPPEEEPKPSFEQEATPIAGGASRVELPEILTPPKPADIVMSVPEQRVTMRTGENRISPFEGSGLEGAGEWKGGGTLIDVSQLDRQPRARVQIPPDYPYALKQTGSGGTVMVEFEVDTTGRVVRAEATRYTDREFVEPALRAVRKWRFEPGRRNGRAVPFRMSIPIEFGIEPGT